MAKLEVTKTIEARKLNKRTRQTLSEPPVNLPYGAILDNIIENRDMLEFDYLGEPYTCKAEVLRAASHPIEGSPMPASAAASAPQPEVIGFAWEKLGAGVWRAKLPGGWLIGVGDSSARSVAFYPDAGHEWNGQTL